jgi:hypothetical protein
MIEKGNLKGNGSEKNNAKQTENIEILYLIFALSIRLGIETDSVSLKKIVSETGSPYLCNHKVLAYIEYRAVCGVFRTIDLPPPLHPASVSSTRTKGGEGYTLAGR